MRTTAPPPDVDVRSSMRRDWLVLYLAVTCCVAIAAAVILVATGVL